MNHKNKQKTNQKKPNKQTKNAKESQKQIDKKRGKGRYPTSNGEIGETAIKILKLLKSQAFLQMGKIGKYNIRWMANHDNRMHRDKVER